MASTRMGREYNAMLEDRTTLLLQLRGTAAAAAGDDERWARQVRTRIRPGLFTHITRETNR